MVTGSLGLLHAGRAGDGGRNLPAPSGTWTASAVSWSALRRGGTQSGSDRHPIPQSGRHRRRAARRRSGGRARPWFGLLCLARWLSAHQRPRGCQCHPHTGSGAGLRQRRVLPASTPPAVVGIDADNDLALLKVDIQGVPFFDLTRDATRAPGPVGAGLRKPHGARAIRLAGPGQRRGPPTQLPTIPGPTYRPTHP